MADPFLSDALGYLSGDRLRALARRFTAKPPMRVADMRAYLAGLRSPAQLSQTVGLLEPTERDVLAAVAYGSGLLRADHLGRLGLTVPKLGGWRDDFYDRSPISRLLLFFPDGDQLSRELIEGVRRLCPDPWPPCPATIVTVADPGGIPDTWDGETAVEILLEQVRQKKLTMTLRGSPAKDLTMLCRFGGSCGVKAIDKLRWASVLRILQAGRFVAAKLDLLTIGRSLAAESPLRELFTIWKDESDFDEALDLPQVNGLEAWLAKSPKVRRQRLLSLLAEQPVDAWIRLPDFLAQVEARHLDLQVMIDHSQVVFLGKRYYGNALGDLGWAGVDRLRNAWICAVLGGTLAALGVVEIRADELPPIPSWHVHDPPEDTTAPYLGPCDGVTAFRLTSRGAWLLGVGPAPQVAASSTLGGWRIQADGTVICLSAKVAARDQVALESLAEPVDERSWRLTRAKLMVALAGGLSPTDLRQRLAGFADPLPATVAAMVEEAIRRHTAITVSAPIHLLTCTDDHAYQTLVHDRKTRDQVIDCGSRRIAVSPLHLEAVRKAAKALGWHIPPATFLP